MENATSDIDVQGISVSDTWQPLYVSMVMTLLQVVTFLLLFEIARRHEQTWTVYDRRRLLYPNRTPPPLSKQSRRYWCCYYPTWWFVKCVVASDDDEAYKEERWKEHRDFVEGLKERQERRKQHRVGQMLDNDTNNNIVLRAEQICLESVPYFREVNDDDTLDNNNDDMKEEGGDTSVATTVTHSTSVAAAAASARGLEVMLGNHDIDECNDTTAQNFQTNVEQQRVERGFSESIADYSVTADSSLRILEQVADDDDEVEVWDAYEEDIVWDAAAAIEQEKTRPVEDKRDAKVKAVLPQSNAPNVARVHETVDTVLPQSNERNVAKVHETVDAALPRSNAPNVAKLPETVDSESSSLQQHTESRDANVLLIASNATDHADDTANVETSAAKPPVPRPSSILRRSKSLPDRPIKMKESSFFFTPTPTKKQANRSTKSIFSERNTRSEHNAPLHSSVPFEVGGDVGPSSASGHHDNDGGGNSTMRRVRFDSIDCDDCTVRDYLHRARSGTDITVGSRESVRLAKLRYHKQDDVPAEWDRRLAQAGSRFLRRRVLMLRDSIEDEQDEQQQQPEDDDNDAGAQRNSFSEPGMQDQQTKFISRQVMRRPLSVEDQELLRCIGLDAFMTLRFLRFGLDVFFWPLLLAIVTVLPLYLTADGELVGYFRTTILNLNDNTGGGKFWLVVLYEYVHITYILRRLWIEWELFLPLRHDYLKHGDFEKEKYKEQYRLTCLVEYIPASHKNDKSVFQFFDTLFPGQVKRAEVLLNTEKLRMLIRRRLEHIVEYENVTAKLIHQWADYLRAMQIYEQSGAVKRCCRGVVAKPREPSEPTKIVIHRIDREDMHNVFIQPQTAKVRDPRTHSAREWHYTSIQSLNKSIDDEYIRLAREQRRHDPRRPENRLSKWLGIKYISGSDTSSLHSSTAFVEFLSLEVKQAAIQCNLTGVSDLMEVSAVPEIRDIIWENAHVSRALIETRKVWADVLILAGLVGWSFVVYLIRSYTGYADWFGFKSATLIAFMEFYLPALVVEGLVRGIPYVLQFICQWIRFKSASEKDTFVLLWYFLYRLITFVFLIVGGSLVDTGALFIEDPVGYLQRLATNVALESQFFISYVLVTGGMSIIYYLCQLHNVAEHWAIHRIITEEAVSQRKLDEMKNRVKLFYKPELVPLFLFIFIIGALYAAIAPIAGVFVSLFFRCAYKVFKYMTLYIYGKHYENGGQLFYHLSSIVFFILYLVVLIIIGYLSLHGSGLLAGVFSIILLVVLATQLHIHKTFVAPSRTLSLAEARILDDKRNARNGKQRKTDAYYQTRAHQRNMRVEGDMMRVSDSSLMRSLLERGAHELDEEEGTVFTDSNETTVDTSEVERADRRMQDRYREEQDSVSDVTDEDTRSNDFFIYRQPSMNRATWEIAPRPYRQRLDRDAHCEVWR